MEPISEERQRRIYEWAYPELKRAPDWYLEESGYACEVPSGDGICQLPALYVKDSSGNWQPNYQWFHTDCMARLQKEADVTFRHGLWDIQPWKEAYDSGRKVREDIIAVVAEYAEYVEAK
jgi:hypothetical protein